MTSPTEPRAPGVMPPTDRSRQPAGVRDGGQFARSRRAESGVSLGGEQLFVVTAARHDGTAVYVSFEVGLDLRTVLQLRLAPAPMRERSARRVARLAERDPDLSEVQVLPA